MNDACSRSVHAVRRPVFPVWRITRSRQDMRLAAALDSGAGRLLIPGPARKVGCVLMTKTTILMAGGIAALSLAATSAQALTFIATGSDASGPLSAKAVITITGGQMTVNLTNLISAASSGKMGDGEELSGIQIFLKAKPTSASLGSASGQLINIGKGGAVTDVSGAPDHWGVALSGSDLYLATAGTGSVGAKPSDLIIGDAASYPTANSSIIGHGPEIQGTGNFVIDLVGAVNDEVTQVKFEFGTNPDAIVNGLCSGMGCGGTAVPEPATWAMMLVGFFGLGALLRRRRALKVA
jgi:hypothetical protein